MWTSYQYSIFLYQTRMQSLLFFLLCIYNLLVYFLPHNLICWFTKILIKANRKSLLWTIVNHRNSYYKWRQKRSQQFCHQVHGQTLKIQDVEYNRQHLVLKNTTVLPKISTQTLVTKINSLLQWDQIPTERSTKRLFHENWIERKRQLYLQLEEQQNFVDEKFEIEDIYVGEIVVC